MHEPRRSCYDHPNYYELAFSFRDIALEVDVMEATMRTYARRPVSTVLQLACGPAQHMLEIARRGYGYVGLDISSAMLDHARRVARAAGVSAEFVQQSMVEFRLDAPVDYVFIALGDLYVQSSAQLMALLDAVATALSPGGLFLLDWCIQFEPAHTFKPESDQWEMSRDGVLVKASVKMVPVSAVEQLFEEQLDMDVFDAGKRLHLSSHSLKRAVYPQEFLALIAQQAKFDFLGWWNNWRLAEPLDRDSRDLFRPITLLRRR